MTDSMSKADMASYLVSLHTLLEAQTKGSHSLGNQSLAWEYERYWEALTSKIKQEKEDEARKRDLINKRSDEARDSNRENQPGSREPDWPGLGVSRPSDDHGQGSSGPIG